MKIEIIPSILSIPQEKYQKILKELEPYFKTIQFDIMDGKFVKGKTYDYRVIKKIKTKINKEVHLMVEKPLKNIDNYIDAGASTIIFHIESLNDENKIKETAKYLKKKKVKFGLGMNPKTPLSKIEHLLDCLDKVLFMTRYPGTISYPFDPSVLKKIRQLRKLKKNIDIEVDGSINKTNLSKVIKAGANQIVIGSSLFKGDFRENLKGFKRIIKANSVY